MLKSINVDIRTKIIAAAVFSTLALIYQAPAVLGVLLCFNLAVLALFGARVRVHKRTVIFLLNLYLLLILLQSLFVRSGTVLFSLGGIPLVTTGGLLYGLSVSLRFFIFIASGLLLAGGRTADLVCALTSFRVPYEIVFMVQVGIRFVPLLIGEIQNTVQSIQLRGVDLRKVYKRKVFKVYVSLFIPILYTIWRKAEKISILLELKGFRRYDTRTSYRTLSFQAADYYSLVLLSLFAVIFVFWTLL